MFASFRHRLREGTQYGDGWMNTLAYAMKRPGAYRFRWGDLRFHMRMEDRVAFSEIVLDGEYGFLDEVVKSASQPRIIDLGANIGLFSLLAFRWNAAASVVAVEPAPDTYALLHATQLLNPQLKWITQQVAISDRAGTVPFSLGGASTGRRIMGKPGDRTVNVPAQTLEQFAQQHFGTGEITLLKMDIEGAEGTVLPASLATLRRVGVLTVELHDGVDTDRCIGLLRQEFPHLQKAGGRTSSKPLLVASRRMVNHTSLSSI